MWTTPDGRRLIIIGENIHATRVVLRAGKSAATDAEGRPCVRFVGADGSDSILPLPASVLEGQAYEKGRIKLVEAAIVAARSGGAGAEAGLGLLRALALRQAGAGADYLDLNVDEVTDDPAERAAAMAWLVRTIEPLAAIPLALDSSSAAVIEAGLGAWSGEPATLLLNSASAERPEVLDLAAAAGCSVVVSAAGRASMPAGAEERVANAAAIVEEALRRGIPLERQHVDALVVPVGVDPDAGGQYLGAIRALRESCGAAIHLTGGFSNVSFGLPARRLLNAVFLALAVDAGADSAIVDPLATDQATAFGDRESRPWQLAADFLTGRDPYGGKYLRAFRAGELEAARA